MYIHIYILIYIHTYKTTYLHIYIHIYIYTCSSTIEAPKQSTNMAPITQWITYMDRQQHSVLHIRGGYD